MTQMRQITTDYIFHKAVDKLCEQHELQLINYLKATLIEVGLLLNFGEKPQVRRKIFTNDKKTKSAIICLICVLL